MNKHQGWQIQLKKFFILRLELIVGSAGIIIFGLAWEVVGTSGIVNPMFPTIEIVFLNGQRVPQIEQLPINESLGMSFRSYLDWGGSVLDYRGIYKNAGE